MSADILIVEDEQAIRQMLEFALLDAGYAPRLAANVEEAQKAIADAQPDLILLDWMLPGVSGVDLARRLRRDSRTAAIPVIMLTARGEEHDKVQALDTGADDYITKPFSSKELMARIRALLRRSASGNTQTGKSPDILDFDGLRIDTRTHRVSVGEQTLELSPTEFRLLLFFALHPERVHSRTQLLDSVWGNDIYIEERTVDVHIRRLRKALEPHGFERYIQTVRSVGYRFSRQS